MRARLTALVSTLLLLGAVSASALPGFDTATGPVKCAEGDLTPDDRVFPEPVLSATALSFEQFSCGIALLESQHEGLIDVDVLDTTLDGNPIYDVRVTDEQVPEADKQHMLVISSIHGNEEAGREGGARVIEDMVDPRFLHDTDWVQATLQGFVVHMVFANPDGWVAGDVLDGGGVMWDRTNGQRDLNRNFPVQGYLRASNGTQDTVEGRAITALLARYADPRDADDPDYRGWSYGTDNHGQTPKAVAASGLQIVGQFDFRKSERLAAFADGIEDTMREFDVTGTISTLNDLTDGQVFRPYEWGTLYDILGYSASGSGIDYYNTPELVNGTGFATEMTAAHITTPNMLVHFGLVNQMWVDTVRSINYTMFREAVDPPDVTFPLGGRVAYVGDPELVSSTDFDGFGLGNEQVPADFTGDDVDPDFAFTDYEVTRMRFFTDLNRYASTPLEEVRVPDVLAGDTDLSAYDSVVLADDPMPEGEDLAGWAAALTAFAEGGGNLVVTDAAAPILAEVVDDIAADDIAMVRRNVGYADFVGDSHLNDNLRGVASQTYDVIPIGMRDGGGDAPNWRVASEVWEAGGGVTAGTNGDGWTIYGERPLGEGKVSFLGALLPQPTEDHFHPYGLQSYAVTYTGYTLLENMLDHTAG